MYNYRIILAKELANPADKHTFIVTGNSCIFATAASSQVEIGKWLASPKKIELTKHDRQSRSISISPSSWASAKHRALFFIFVLDLLVSLTNNTPEKPSWRFSICFSWWSCRTFCSLAFSHSVAGDVPRICKSQSKVLLTCICPQNTIMTSYFGHEFWIQSLKFSLVQI